MYVIIGDIIVSIANGQSEASASSIYNIFTVLDNLQVIYSLLTCLISKC